LLACHKLQDELQQPSRIAELQDKKLQQTNCSHRTKCSHCTIALQLQDELQPGIARQPSHGKQQSN
jgi:hypothetical protein